MNARQRRAELRAKMRKQVVLGDVCRKRRCHRLPENGTTCMDCGAQVRA